MAKKYPKGLSFKPGGKWLIYTQFIYWVLENLSSFTNFKNGQVKNIQFKNASPVNAFFLQHIALFSHDSALISGKH